MAGRYVHLACQRHLDDRKRERTKAFPYYFDPGEVAQLLEFFQDYLTLDDVDEHDRPIAFTLVRWMQFCLGSLVGWKRAENGHLRFVEAYLETGKGSTKCLALDTPIATPTGWTTIEALQVGNQVFDDLGRATDVIAVSNVKHGLPCYRVVFDDGTAIVADADHLWFTERRTFSKRGQTLATAGVKRSERGRWKHGLRTTVEIANTLRYANGRHQSANHSIPLAAPLGLPSADLPIDPYVLGFWLGDGDSDCARVTIGDQDLEAIEHLTAAGVAVGERQGPIEKTGRYRLGGRPTETCQRGHPRATDTVNGHCRACERERRRAARLGEDASAPTLVAMATRLRALGLFGNKHVPASYLRSAIDQRLGLLQGLMDSDGQVLQVTGGCRFTSTKKRLADGVSELVVSLGIKCTVHERRATLYGRDVSACWVIEFHPPHDLPVFRLTRKARWQYQRHTRRRLSGERRIVDVQPVPSVPVKCIAVNAPSHLFLAGKTMVPTHNTPALAGYGLYRLVGANRTNVEIYSLGVNSDQANYLYQFAKRMCERSEDLRDLLNVGEYNTAWVARNSFFRPLTSEGRSLDNKRVFTALIDELHEVPAIIPEKMRLGIKTQVDGQVVMITNAGYDKTSVCWTKHDYGTKVLEGTLVDEEYFPYICQLDPCEACRANGLTQPDDACKACDDWTDERVWPKVNPAILDLPQLSTYLRGVVRQALNQPSTLARTKRLNFCCWCVTADTLITMADGRLIRAGDLLAGERILAFDDQSRELCIGTVQIVRSNGVTPIHHIATARGRKIDVTPNHKFWTRSGRAAAPIYKWVEAQELRRGDRVAVGLGYIKHRGGRRVSADVAQFLGIMIGDGTTTRPRLTATNPGVIDFCRIFATARGCQLAPLPDGAHFDFRHAIKRQTPRQTPIRTLLKHYGLNGQTCYTKRVPALLFSAGASAWAAFLSGYLDTDGHVTPRSIQWTSINEPLLKDCQHLLALLGVQSTVRTVRSRDRRLGREADRTCHRLEVHNAAALAILVDVLTPSHTEKATRLTALRQLRCKAVADSPVAGDEMLFDRVTRSQASHETETIGIEVADVHTHITNGLITHNTQSHSIWIPSDQWDACRSETVRPSSGVPCAAAFDMSMKLDLTGCAIAQRFDDPPTAKEETVEIDENENGQTVKRIWKIKYRIRLTTFAWLPEDTLVERVKNEQIPYDVWRRAGHLRVTPGPVIDENEIYDQFVGEIGPAYKPQRVGYDPYNATGFAVDLRDRAKYTVVEIGQGRRLSEFIKLFYALVRLRRIEHDGNPVFAWCVANAEPKHDRYENIWLEKPSGGKRIDLAIAAVMALSQVLVLPVPRHRRRGTAKIWTPDGWRDDDAQAHA